jgi:hypothetical protein
MFRWKAVLLLALAALVLGGCIVIEEHGGHRGYYGEHYWR